MQLSIINNIKFAFRTYARAHMTDYELNIGNSKWDDFKKSLTVRDRLMHPKRVEDLEVSDEEMDRLQRAYDWFTAATLEVMNLSLENMTKDVKSKLTAEQAEQLDRVLHSIK